MKLLFFPVLIGPCGMLLPIRPTMRLFQRGKMPCRRRPSNGNGARGAPIYFHDPDPVMAGLVFLLEGSLKFIRPEESGAERFAALGLPYPHYLGLLVGGIEIGGGVAILMNFYAGDAALVLLVAVVTSLIANKFPILLGRLYMESNQETYRHNNVLQQSIQHRHSGESLY